MKINDEKFASLSEYVEEFGILPKHLTFSIAAFMGFSAEELRAGN